MPLAELLAVLMVVAVIVVLMAGYPVALTLARQISDKSPHALMIGKETFYRQVDMPLAAAYDHASAVMVENMMIADACEGIAAFLEKRRPIWPKA